MPEIEKAFSNNPLQGRQRLRIWKDDDFAEFVKQSVSVLRRGEDDSFTQLILQLLREDGTSLERLLFTHDLLTLEEAAKVVRLASKTDPEFSIRLTGQVKSELDKANSSSRSEDLARMLEILAASVDPRRLAPMMNDLCVHADQRIRSKAVLLFGTELRRLSEGAAFLLDPDPRVRANAVEGLWDKRDAESIASFKEAAKDPHHRVAANALFGLYKAGDLSSLALISRMATEGEVLHRLAGIWLIGQTEDWRFSAMVQSALDVTTGRLRVAFIRAARMIKQRRAQVLEGPKLSLELLRRERAGNGRVRIAFLAFREDRSLCAPGDLRGTDLIIHDGDLRVSQFSYNLGAPPGTANPSLFAAFLIPLRTGVSQNFATQLVTAMETGIAAKRRSDQWTIQKYLVNTPAGTGSEMAAIEFASSAEVLRAEQLRASRGASPSLIAAADRLTQFYPPGSDKKHLVILLDPDLSHDSTGLTELAAKCGRAKIVPHVIACGALDPEAAAAWDKLCTSHQGLFLLCANAGELPHTLKQLCLSMQSCFQITYRLGRILPSPGPEPIRIEAVAEAGYGELLVEMAHEPQAIP